MTSTRHSEVILGLDTFGDVAERPDGGLKHPAQVIRDVVDQGVLADQVGVDAIGIGEHHRDDFAVTSPDVVLAAIAARTERILLGSAVTVLSSDDPVRVFERFSTLDAISAGRAELTLGRGSFTESFPLFGYDLADYEVLFEEKLDLFVRLLTERGWPPMGRHEFEREAGPRGSLYVGSPETVAHKIAHTVRTLGIERFDLKYSNGPMPHERSMRAIELYGTEVIPRVRNLLAAGDAPIAV